MEFILVKRQGSYAMRLTVRGVQGLAVTSVTSAVEIGIGLHARRGPSTLDTEHLFCADIEDGRVTEAFFAPVDQELYDRFWQVQ